MSLAIELEIVRPRLTHVVGEHPDCFIGMWRLSVSNGSSHLSNSAIRLRAPGG
jgi:hypothetical protein